MQRLMPVLVLALLATIVPEVLFGSTPLTEPGRILATMPLYAGGAILIRELARRRRVGWPQIAMLGVVYGIVEEGLALGSFFNPAMFNAGLIGGRLCGTNWTWIQWTLGYHAVWSIAIPILLAELLFPDRRAEPWLGRIGLSIAAVAYLAGVSLMAVIARSYIAPDFEFPIGPLVAALLVAAGLAVLALGRPARAPDPEILPAQSLPDRDAPSPWVVGALATIVAGVWFWLLLLPGPIKSGGWIVLPMVLALALLGMTITLTRRWSAPGRRWTDLHRLALAVGPLPVNMLFGSVYVTRGQPAAHLAQAIACVGAIILLAVFVLLVRQRPEQRARASGASGMHQALTLQ